MIISSKYFLFIIIKLKGYGLQKNEQMVDRILMECVKYSVKPDIILFNGAIDAYIRYIYFFALLFSRTILLPYITDLIQERVT